MNRATIERPLLGVLNSLHPLEEPYRAWRNRTWVDEAAIMAVMWAAATRCDVFYREGEVRWIGLNWDALLYPVVVFAVWQGAKLWLNRTLVRGYEFCVCPRVRPLLAMLVMLMSIGATVPALLHFVVGLTVAGVIAAVVL